MAEERKGFPGLSFTTIVKLACDFVLAHRRGSCQAAAAILFIPAMGGLTVAFVYYVPWFLETVTMLYRDHKWLLVGMGIVPGVITTCCALTYAIPKLGADLEAAIDAWRKRQGDNE